MICGKCGVKFNEMKEYNSSNKMREYKIRVTFQFGSLITAAICLLTTDSNGVDVLAQFVTRNLISSIKSPRTDKGFILHEYKDDLGIEITTGTLESTIIMLTEDELLEQVVGVEIMEVGNEID